MSDSAARESAGAAIAWLLFGMAMAVGLDITGKWLLGTYALPQFVLLRSLLGGLMLLALARSFGGLRSLRTRRPGWHVLRTLLAAGAMFGFFWGLSQIPLMDTLTIAFTAPLITTALSALVLKDPVGWRRWLAVGTGFVGVLVVLRPGGGLASWAALAVLASAFFYACLAITARHLTTTENSYSLSLYVLVGPLFIAAFAVPGQWQAPAPVDWLLFAAAGVCSAGAWIGIVNGYRRASPALLAPFEYLALPGGALAGYLIWDEVPGRSIVIGAAIIIGSGLFVAYREIERWTAAGRYLRAATASGAAATAAQRNADSQAAVPPDADT